MLPNPQSPVPPVSFSLVSSYLLDSSLSSRCSPKSPVSRFLYKPLFSLPYTPLLPLPPAVSYCLLSPSASLGLYLSLCASLCLFLSLCASLCLLLSLCASLCLGVSPPPLSSAVPSVPLYLYLSRCVSICLFVSRYVSLCLYLSLYLSVCLFFVSLCISLCVCVYICLFVSRSVSMCLHVSVPSGCCCVSPHGPVSALFKREILVPRIGDSPDLLKVEFALLQPTDTKIVTQPNLDRAP